MNNVTLKANCDSCGSLLYKKGLIVRFIPDGALPFINKALKKLFPMIANCKECDSDRITYSYIFLTEHKFSNNEALEHQLNIDRCKAQIAETFNSNSDIPLKERESIREILQFQLAKLLELKTPQLS